MGKRALYSIVDEEFMTLLDRTNSAFRDITDKHMFVGGVANQFYISSILCDLYKKPLMELMHSGEIRVQDYLRASDDIDLVLGFSNYKEEEVEDIQSRTAIFGALNEISEGGPFISPSQEHLVSIRLARRAHVRPQFQLGLDDEGNPEKLIGFNLYRGPKDVGNRELAEFEKKYFDRFLDNGEDVTIPYSDNTSVSLRVKSLEDHMATKIARGRPKDIQDALSLTSVAEQAKRVIDYSIIEELLKLEEFGEGELVERYDAFKVLKNLNPGH